MKRLIAPLIGCYLAAAAAVAESSGPPVFQMRLVLDAPFADSEQMRRWMVWQLLPQSPTHNSRSSVSPSSSISLVIRE